MNKRVTVFLVLVCCLFFCITIWMDTKQMDQVNAAMEDVGGGMPTEAVTGISAAEQTSGLTPSEGPASGQEPTAVPSGEPTIVPSAEPTATPGGQPIVTQRPTASLNPVKRGWQKTKSGKKYYIRANGKRAKGYKVIDGDEYYFNSKGYAITKRWKYVELKGKNYKLYFGKNGKRKLDVTKLLPGNTYFRLEVNLSKNIVMVYARDGQKGYTIPVRAMVCSAGMKGHRTITGTYSRLSRAGNWHVLRYNSMGQYCTRISGPYLFHSVVYKRYGDRYSLQKAEYKKLGKSASHGCIRLQVADAKWIYDRAYRCSVSLYYNKSAKYPLKKPKAEKIRKKSPGRYYDPTDPNC